MEDIIFLYINKDYLNNLLYKLKSETEILLETVDFCRKEKLSSIFLPHSYFLWNFIFHI